MLNFYGSFFTLITVNNRFFFYFYSLEVTAAAMFDVILEIFQVPGSRSSTKSNQLLLVLRFFPSKDFMKIGDSIKSIRDQRESVDWCS